MRVSASCSPKMRARSGSSADGAGASLSAGAADALALLAGGALVLPGEERAAVLVEVATRLPEAEAGFAAGLAALETIGAGRVAAWLPLATDARRPSLAVVAGLGLAPAWLSGSADAVALRSRSTNMAAIGYRCFMRSSRYTSESQVTVAMLGIPGVSVGGARLHEVAAAGTAAHHAPTGVA